MEIVGLLGLFMMIFAAGVFSFSENRSKGTLTVSTILMVIGLCAVIVAVNALK